MTKKCLATCTLLLSSVITLPANAGLYSFSKVEYPASSYSATSLEVNRSGQFAVSLLGDNQTSYIWTASGMQMELQTPSGYGSQVISLNDRGTAVGFSYDLYANDSRSRAVVWSGASLHLLPGLSETAQEVALDINDLGNIVGYSYKHDVRLSRALFWDADGLHDLGIGSGVSAAANAINNANTIVGSTRFADGTQNGTIWKDGTVTHIGTLGGTRSVLADVNDLGWAVGDSLLEGDQDWRAVLWDGIALRDLGTLGGQWSTANNIGADGTVFGSALTASEQQHATIWRNGSAIDLHDLVVNLADMGSMNMMTAIGSDSKGAIYGILYDPNTYTTGTFILTPVDDNEVPEPAPITLLLIGVAYLASQRKSSQLYSIIRLRKDVKNKSL